MRELIDARAVLFQSEDEGESLCIECAATREGGLAVLQESDGPLTLWCFEESPHRIETEVAPEDMGALLVHFRADNAGMLPAMLRMRFTGHESGQRIRRMLRGLQVPYRVYENAPVR